MDWDYVASDPRNGTRETSSAALFECYQQMKRYLNVNVKRASSGDDSIPYQRHQPLRLMLPDTNHAS